MRASRTYTFFILYILLNFISGFVVLMLMGSGADQTLFSAVWQAVFFIPLIIIGTKMGGGAQSLSFGRVSPVDIVSAVFLAFAIIPLLSLISALSALFFPNTAADTLHAARETPFVLSLVSLCLMPAVFEELTFRGIIFSGFKNFRLKTACVMGGLLFALAHFSLQSFLYTFLTGTLFCFMLYRTKSVIPGMVTHFTINLSQVLLSRAVYSAPAESAQASQGVISPLQILWLAFLSLFISFYLLSLMGRKYGRGRPLFAPPVKKGFVIETEEVFDYAPERGCGDRIFDIRLIIILIVYFLYVFYPYFLI